MLYIISGILITIFSILIKKHEMNRKISLIPSFLTILWLILVGKLKLNSNFDYSTAAYLFKVNTTDEAIRFNQRLTSALLLEIKEECGIAAVSLKKDGKALFYLYRLLLNLQNRGQLSAGIDDQSELHRGARQFGHHTSVVGAV